MHNLNLLAIIVGRIATMPTVLWYSPAVISQSRMREMGYDPNDKERIRNEKAGWQPKHKFCRFLADGFPPLSWRCSSITR